MGIVFRPPCLNNANKGSGRLGTSSVVFKACFDSFCVLFDVRCSGFLEFS